MDSKKLHERFGELLEEMANLHRTKGEDYESEEVEFTDYYFSSRDVWLQVNRKALRLRSLINRESMKPNYESMKDNAIDLAVFSLLLAAWIDLEEKDGNS